MSKTRNARHGQNTPRLKIGLVQLLSWCCQEAPRNAGEETKALSTQYRQYRELKRPTGLRNQESRNDTEEMSDKDPGYSVPRLAGCFDCSSSPLLGWRELVWARLTPHAGMSANTPRGYAVQTVTEKFSTGHDSQPSGDSGGGEASGRQK